MKDPFEDASADVGRSGAALILVALIAALVGLAIFRPGSRDVLAIILGLVLMVMLHEAGHFIAAKKTGMKATEFFIGFGPKLWSFRRGETEYGVKAILLGGYVKIIGMTNVDEVDPADEHRTYRKASHKNRFIVVMAGVTVNVLIALLLYFAYFAAGGEIYDGPSTAVARVVDNSAAQAAGLRRGDRIAAVDGERVNGWEHLVQEIESRPDETISLTIVRRGDRIQVEATPKARKGLGFLGIGPQPQFRTVGLLAAVPESFKAIGEVTSGTANALGDLFSPEGISEYSKNFTAEAPKEGSPESNARPRSIIGIIDFGSDIVNGDVLLLLQLLAGVSLVLALFNTLPLLPFDGGHAAIVVYEAIASRVKKRDVRADYRKLMPVTAVVLALFLAFALSAMFLDIRDAVGG